MCYDKIVRCLIETMKHTILSISLETTVKHLSIFIHLKNQKSKRMGKDAVKIILHESSSF